MRRMTLLAAGLVMLAWAGPNAAQQSDPAEMTHERYAAYLSLFNAADPNYADYFITAAQTIPDHRHLFQALFMK